MNLLLAIVVGLMGGIGLTFLLEYLDNTVKRIDEISDRFGIPVLGVLLLVNADEVPNLDHIVRTSPKAALPSPSDGKGIDTTLRGIRRTPEVSGHHLGYPG